MNIYFNKFLNWNAEIFTPNSKLILIDKDTSDSRIIQLDENTYIVKVEAVQDIFDFLKQYKDGRYFIEYDEADNKLWLREHSDIFLDD